MLTLMQIVYKAVLVSTVSLSNIGQRIKQGEHLFLRSFAFLRRIDNIRSVNTFFPTFDVNVYL